MEILTTVYGHDRVKEVLRRAFLQGALPYQLLFVGPEGIGKKKIAWGLSQILLCQRLSDQGVACGQCSSCLKIQSGFHESILFIEPEKNLIKIEKAREIQSFLSLSHDEKARIVIVDNAHFLNQQASNALLKLVEEPPARVYFFFITHRWAQVLPTIRSRMTKIPVAPLSEEDLSRWMEPSNEATELLRFARGSVKELLEQKQEESSMVRQEAYELFQRFFSDKNYLILGDWRDRIKDKDKLILYIRYWLTSLHEYLYQKNKQDGFNQGESLLPHLRGLMDYHDDVIWSLWEKGLTLEAGVLGHRDPVLLLEEWLLVTEDKQKKKGFSYELMD